MLWSFQLFTPGIYVTKNETCIQQNEWSESAMNEKRVPMSLLWGQIILMKLPQTSTGAKENLGSNPVITFN